MEFDTSSKSLGSVGFISAWSHLISGFNSKYVIGIYNLERWCVLFHYPVTIMVGRDESGISDGS